MIAAPGIIALEAKRQEAQSPIRRPAKKETTAMGRQQQVARHAMRASSPSARNTKATAVSNDLRAFHHGVIWSGANEMDCAG